MALQHHSQYWDGEFAGDGKQDIARIGGAATVDVFAVDGIERIA